ncbi:MAG: TonB-dependent receptor, partial [Exilibacterium sp.]
RTGYDQIGSGNVTVDLDDKFIRSPETSINLGLSYSFPWSNGAELEGRLDWVYRSNIEYEPDNDAHVSEDGYQVYDFNLVYHPPNAVWSLQLGVRNLTDERYMLAGDSNREFGYALAVFARPRNAWLTVSWEF